MRVLEFSVLLAACAVLATGCGEKRLTAAEKAEFLAFSKSNNAPMTAAFDAQRASTEGATSGELEDASLEEEKEIQRKMIAALTDGSCQFSPFTPGSLSFDFTVSGEACPIDMRMSLDFNIGQPKSTFVINSFYKVKQDSFAALSDVLSSKMDGSFVTTISSSSSTVTTEGLITGNVISKKYGEVPFRGEMEGGFSDGNGQITTTFTWLFKSFPKVKMKMVTSAGGVTYYINGEKLNQEQWEEYMAGSYLGKAGGGASGTP